MEQGELTLLCVVEKKTEETLPVVQTGMGAIATSHLKLLLRHDSKCRTVYTAQTHAKEKGMRSAAPAPRQ